MMKFDHIAMAAQLVLCPHCGGNGEFVMVPIQELTEHPVPDHYSHVTYSKTRCLGCGHESRLLPATKGNIGHLVDDWIVGATVSPKPVLTLPNDVPLVMNCGVGVDSVATLVALAQAGIVPDYILFADVGDEKPETMQYRDYLSDWLVSKGFPPITTVRYRPERASYDTLEGNCLANETLPSISISGKGSCTLKFKGAVMDKYLLGAKRGPWKGEGCQDILDAIESGKRPIKLIGYDYGAADTCRFKKASNLDKENDPFDYHYPLQEQLKWTREDCILEIVKAGLVVPLKSSCFYCCGTKKWEILWMAAEHPELLVRATYMEDIARNGKHGFVSTKGLGRSFGWRPWCEKNGIIEPGTYNIVANKQELLAQVREEMPPLENYLTFDLPERLNKAA